MTAATAQLQISRFPSFHGDSDWFPSRCGGGWWVRASSEPSSLQNIQKCGWQSSNALLSFLHPTLPSEQFLSLEA